MNWARNSDSKTHAEKSNPTSRTDFSSKTLRDIFFWVTLYIPFSTRTTCHQSPAWLPTIRTLVLYVFHEWWRWDSNDNLGVSYLSRGATWALANHSGAEGILGEVVRPIQVSYLSESVSTSRFRICRSLNFSLGSEWEIIFFCVFLAHFHSAPLG